MRESTGFALLMVTVLGCSSAPDISEELEAYGDLLGSVHALTCDCPADLGYSSSLDCREDFGVVGPVRRDCMASTLDGYEEAAKPFLDCANLAMRNYEVCLEDNLAEGCVEGQYLACASALDSELADCPALPVLDEFLACANN